ncbi:hypothetical protein POVWA2_043750 [Plasmodium ovale wallikeri]|uniref:Uncharacterized protein n=1 Tax=Plasmodium ovale wallikeri TaxID=864142 RepID=A0A1A8ZEH4_PLAOA|nr:hypothetical protein POVWA2_043750 [Plasmodium ovale wallikeri]
MPLRLCQRLRLRQLSCIVLMAECFPEGITASMRIPYNSVHTRTKTPLWTAVGARRFGSRRTHKKLHIFSCRDRDAAPQ